MSGEDNLIFNSFETIYKLINELKVKRKVDQIGIDAYINECALYAAGSGALTSLGGFLTALAGIPADMANLILQEFRVVLGVIYHKTGRYRVTFVEFMKIYGASLGIEVATLGVRVLLEEIGTRIISRAGAQAVGKLTPFLGAIVVGGGNYALIHWLGATVMKVDIKKYAVEPARPADGTRRPKKVQAAA